jgi:hypothetical protein
MADEAETGWSRRDFVGAASLLALAVGVPGAAAFLSGLDANEAPSDRQVSLMREVAQLVIPRSETPGAGDAGAGAFVILALAHGLDGTRKPAASAEMPFAFPNYQRPDGSLRFVDWQENTLDRAAGGDWLGKPGEERQSILAALDAEAFAEGADAHPWRKIKGLILTGYYTSEPGGAQELRYEPDAGRFEPKLPQTPETRAMSNDWTAVEFG